MKLAGRLPLRELVDVWMMEQLFRRLARVFTTRDAAADEVSCGRRGSGRQLVHGRVLSRDLEYCSDTLVLMPRGISRQHFDNRATQAPVQ